MMNCLMHVSTYGAVICRRSSSHLLVANGSLHTYFSSAWSNSYNHEAIRIRNFNLELLLTRFRAQRFSSQTATTDKKTRSRKSKVKAVLDQGKDAFFVVRKEDVIGVYKNFSDCQAQVGTSICDPPVSVFKGYSLPKDAEEYLISHGLKGALYTIDASDLTKNIFGSLSSCAIQVSSASVPKLSTDTTEKWSQYVLEVESSGSCCIEFDGASKGNPGPGGAGAVVKSPDGTVICRLREGLGTVTNNAAEYRAVILGLRYALSRGYANVHVQGDSKLVCKQIDGSWRARSENLSNLYKEAKELKEKFPSFHISHVLRELNSDADAKANLGIKLAGAFFFFET
ncbi:uncharacterized protein [Rutidosis leptorrhynchoides]|uniref:uncharacterized protein n=1 Tax=Rutidosis leptorrhynchoides TaxID=125765 RepID=UPI003A99945F